MLGAALVIGLFTAVPQAQAAAPDAPTVMTPAAGENVDGLVELTWNRPDGAVEFDVQVDDAGDFATPLASVSNTVNLRYVPTVELPGGELWWRVRASDGTTESEWSTESFSRRAKSAPEPIRPLADAVIQPPVDTPRFAWRPVQGATSYRLEVGPDPEFTDPALVISSVQKTTAAVLTGYQTPGTYYWRVSAVLSSGYSTGWSPSLAYTVKGLPAATLASPDDSFDRAVREVVLDWNPVPGAVGYDLQIGTDINFLSGVHSRDGIVGTRYSPPDGLDNDEYYWRVRPVDASGNKAPWPATPWHFRRAWPEQPELVHPRGSVPSKQPLFYQWDPIETASSYTVLLYDAEGRQLCEASTVHTTLANKCVPASAGDYAWKVLARDTGGKLPDPTTDVIGQAGATFSYAPGTATGSGPLTVDMVTGHAASMDGTTAYGVGDERDVCTAALPATCVDVRQTPVLTWDPVPGAIRYRLTLARDRELTNTIETFIVKDPIWTPTETLADSQAGSAYFWVVQPCWTTTSCAPLQHARHSFAKKTVAPELVSPVEAPDENGELVVPQVKDDVTLSWGSQLAALQAPEAANGSSLTTPASTEAKSYVVETSIDPSFNSVIERVTVDQTTFTSFAQTYPEGIVYWRVRAIDGSDNPTVWSRTGQFVKRSDEPQLDTPAHQGTLGADYAFSWAPLAYAASYDIDVFAGPTRVAGSTAWKHASWAPSDPLPASVDGYTWRVRRVDARGRRGEWSSPRTVSAAEVQPSTIAPAQGAVVAPSTSYFSWEPDDRASGYRFERRLVGTTSLAENVTTRATAWAPVRALPAGTWEWRVVTLDTRGATLGASPWREFRVVDPPAVVTPVSIAGSGEVGTELRVSAPTFDPQVDSISYQWYRGTTRLTGETGEIYTVKGEDLGRSLTVRATGVLAGYKPAITTSDPVVGANGSALVAAHPPSIVGRAVVGETLTLDMGVWPETPRLSYQWYRAGEAIPRVTGTSYRLLPADAGKQIHVVETATVAGRTPGTATSSPVQVAKLPSTTALTLSAGRTTPRKRVTASVAVLVTGLSEPGGSVTLYDGRRELKTVPLATSTVQIRLPRLPKGKHVIKAVYSGADQAKRSSGSARLVVRR